MATWYIHITSCQNEIHKGITLLLFKKECTNDKSLLFVTGSKVSKATFYSLIERCTETSSAFPMLTVTIHKIDMKSVILRRELVISNP